MPTYPTRPRSSFLAWCRTHAPVFVEQAPTIGITPAQADAFADDLAEALAAEAERAEAEQAARTATQRAKQKLAQLRSRAGSTVKIIRAHATMSDDPGVYNRAQIPAPAAPTRVDPPAMPTALAASLLPMGELELRWKARNPDNASGTSYIVRRRLPGEREFSFVGVTGEKRFVDDAVPAGAARVEYTAQGQRADSSGAISMILTINFGSLRTTRAESGTNAAGVDGRVTVRAAA